MEMKCAEVLSVMLVAGIAVGGCDFFDRPAQQMAQAEAIGREESRREQIEVSQQQAKSECVALRHLVATRLKMLKEFRAEADREDAEVKADRQRMSARIAEISEANLADKDGTPASALYRMLKDQAINELAFKYLGTDFAMARSDLGEKIREVGRHERGRREELSDNKATFNSAVEEGHKKLAQLKKEQAGRIKRLRDDLAEKERNLRKLRSTMAPAGEPHRQNIRDIRDLEYAINRLKDLIRNEEQSGRVRDAERSIELAQQRAVKERRESDDRVAGKSKDANAVLKLVEEYEGQTIRRLEEELRDRHDAADKRRRQLDGQLSYLKNAMDGIDSLDLQAIRQLRASIADENSKLFAGKDRPGNTDRRRDDGNDRDK